ncbi:MAG: Type 1 glutamine amidotransferase-like domain-containing protein [Lachnospiraceae bacterium]|nr:Type 1 glutamine amidotransferase-like domain-containing protein [Lachnospiraceae bacterium]
MIVFLTSSPTGSLDDSHKVDGLDEMNHFVDNLKKYWKECAKCLIITSSPDEYEANDEMTAFFADTMEKSGLLWSEFLLWDGRDEVMSKEELHTFDVIILGGGHVPTQNQFFHEIGLREKLQGFDGIVIGISAGTMNSADVVYAQPEMPGESVDPDYVKYFEGLGLTQIQILPHYQMVKDYELDGRRLYEDITFGDSYGNNFLVLPDGSYLLSVNGEETIWGEAWRLSDGVMYKVCENNQVKYI